MKSVRGLLDAESVTLNRYSIGEHRTACPRCAIAKPRRGDDALAVKIDALGFQLKCHRCGWETFGLYPNAPRVSISAGAKIVDNAKTEAALHIWREADPIKGTIAETYLRGRRITCAMPNCLRFHPACWHGELRRELPAMVALVSDIETNEPCGLHRTFLKPDGSGKITDGKSKMMLGRAKGAAIKLTPDDEIVLGLGIAEGIETSLSLISHGFQVWSLGSAGNIKSFPVLSGIDALTIFADHDPVGIKAARSCAIRWSSAGVEARVAYPREEGHDWNDVGRPAA